MPDYDSNVAIFWDYENCPVPSNTSGYTITKHIRSLVCPYGSVKSFKAYLGITELHAFKSQALLRSELQSSGVSLIDCPHNGRKEVADKMIIVDMLAHAIDQPPPSTVILISGDRDFAYALSILKHRLYRVILVTLPNAHNSLTAQASLCLDWNNEVLDPIMTDMGRSNKPASFWDPVILGAPHGKNIRMTDDSVDYRADTAQTSRGTTTQNRPRPHLSSFRYPDLEKKGYASAYEDSEVSAVKNIAASVTPPTLFLPHLPITTLQTPSSTTGSSLTLKQQQPCHSSMYNLTDPKISAPSTLSNILCETKTDIAAEESRRPLTVAGNDQSFVFRSEEKARCSRPDQSYASLSVPDVSASLRHDSASSSLPSAMAETALLSTPTIQTATQPLISRSGGAPFGTLPGECGGSSLPPLSVNQPEPLTVVPEIFKILVQTLQSHRSKGVFISLRSSVSTEIAKNGMTYKKAGVGKFGQYVALAEKSGIIELGGKEGGAWISLKPDWYSV